MRWPVGRLKWVFIKISVEILALLLNSWLCCPLLEGSLNGWDRSTINLPQDVNQLAPFARLTTSPRKEACRGRTMTKLDMFCPFVSLLAWKANVYQSTKLRGGEILKESIKTVAEARDYVNTTLHSSCGEMSEWRVAVTTLNPGSWE